jgi:hypothetical protein
MPGRLPAGLASLRPSAESSPSSLKHAHVQPPGEEGRLRRPRPLRHRCSVHGRRHSVLCRWRYIVLSLAFGRALASDHYFLQDSSLSLARTWPSRRVTTIRRSGKRCSFRLLVLGITSSLIYHTASPTTVVSRPVLNSRMRLYVLLSYYFFTSQSDFPL